MFKIDKSSASFIESNKCVVIKQWVSSDAAVQQASQDMGLDQGLVQQQLEEQVQLALERAKIQEQEILQKANMEAAKILQQAKQEAESIQAFALQQGLEEGRREAMRELQTLKAEYREWFEELDRQLKVYQQERDELLERNVLELSYEIAQKVVNNRLEEDESLFLGLVKDSVQKLNAKEEITIKVNPREYQRFFQDGEGFLEKALPGVLFAVVEDDGIAPGGLVVTSAYSVLTAGIDRRFEKIASALEITNCEAAG